MNQPHENNDGFLPSATAPIEPEQETSAASTCPNPIRADLKAFADQELSPLRRAWVRVHLRRCPACREELQEMKKITELFTASAADEKDGAFAPQLRSRVLSRLDGLAPAGTGVTATPASVPSPRPAPLWRKQPALVFGGGGTVLAASLAVFATMNHAQAPNVYVLPKAEPATAPGTPSSAKVDNETFAAGKAQSASANSKTTDARTEDAAKAMPLNDRAEDSVVSGGAAAPPSPVLAEPRPVNVPAAPLRRMEAARGRTMSLSVPRPSVAVASSARTPGGMADKSGAWDTQADDGRQVHKEASLGLRVEPGGLQTASDKVEELVKSTGGFVSSNNLSTDDETGEKSADLTLRVPVKDFESVMASLAKMGNVVSKQLTGEDITEKTTDATTAEQVLVNEAKETAQKLANQSMSEKRTGQKEAELRQIRMQLAQTRARLGLLRKMAALSTINVSLTEKPVKKAAAVGTTHSGFFNGMQETNKAAMQAFQTAVRVPLVLIVWVLAFSPIWVPLILAYRWASLKSLANRVVMSPSTPGED